MKYLKVNLWGREIGRLVWDSTARRSYFIYNPENGGALPDIAPLLSPSKNRNIHLPIYGDERPLYQGLPPFIADSLPDSWGNTLFDKWVKDNKIPRNKVTPLYKLMFIGTRGMGALEYEPCASDLVHSCSVDVKSLYDVSLKIVDDRDNVRLNANDELTLQALLAVGTSAGGRQMKAIVAINNETGEIRSCQADGLVGFEYYIIKFGDKSIPLAEIETAYYRMSVDAGIDMEECRLMSVDGTNHFLTKRFDRKDGKKIHMQTLAAISPESSSYEDLIACGRQLSLAESEIEQLFVRMVFNVLANNTDDHAKNFSFLLEEGGKWTLAPAYDMTFIFNTNGTGPNNAHRMSIGGKTSGISKSDLLEFAKRNEIRNANAIISRVSEAVNKFSEYAQECGIFQPWLGIIQKALSDNLAAFDNIFRSDDLGPSFRDCKGRTITEFSITVNSKGFYDVCAVVDGRRMRRFVRPNMAMYPRLRECDIYNLGEDEKIQLVDSLFS